MAELLLQRRFREHTESLEQLKEEVERNPAGGGASKGYLASGLLVSAWTEALQKHCDRTLAELTVLLKIFDNLSSAEWMKQRFDAHVDQAASQLLQRLADSNLRGALRSSERNKVTNMASTIKGRSRSILDMEIERAAQKQREASESAEPSPAELDDRLPLNRRAIFDQDLVQMVRAAKRTGEPLTLTMIDIDHFKRVNDEYGHPVGDEVLLAVAALVVKRVAHKGKAYRYGGEEFALLLSNYSAEEAVGLAERIRKDIEEATLSSKSLKLTASFGVATVPDHAKDSKTVLEKADTALYEAKNLGRNCVRFSGE